MDVQNLEGQGEEVKEDAGQTSAPASGHSQPNGVLVSPAAGPLSTAAPSDPDIAVSGDRDSEEQGLNSEEQKTKTSGSDQGAFEGQGTQEEIEEFFEGGAPEVSVKPQEAPVTETTRRPSRDSGTSVDGAEFKQDKRENGEELSNAGDRESSVENFADAILTDDRQSDEVKDIPFEESLTVAIEKSLEEIEQEEPPENGNINEPKEDLIYTVDFEENLKETSSDSIDFMMPEPQNGEAIGKEDLLSPSLLTASCRYRWQKTLPTEANDVHFFSSSKMEEPVRLHWTTPGDCYYSEEIEIPCGVYSGNIVVDGRTFPVEDIAIKHYTFEVDLYIREDVIEDESVKVMVRAAQDLEQERLAQNSGSSVDPGKYEKSLAEFDDQKIYSMEEEEGLRSPPPSRASSVASLPKENVIEDVIAPEKMDSSLRASTSQENIIGDFFKANDRFMQNGSYQSPVQSGNVSLNESSLQRLGAAETDVYMGKTVDYSSLDNSLGRASHVSESGRSPARSPHNSNQGNGSPARSLNNSLKEGSPVPVRTSPYTYNVRTEIPTRDTGPDFVSDVIGQSTPVPDSRHSSVRNTPVQSGPSSSRHTPQQIDDVHSNAGPQSYQGSYQGSAAGTPVGSVHGSLGAVEIGSYQGSLAGSQPGSRPPSVAGGSRPASVHSQQGSKAGSFNNSFTGGSRPQSVTSEQELSQYFSDRSDPNRTPTQYTPISPALSQTSATKPGSDKCRSSSAVSLPVITTQQRMEIERRSMTPDNHIRNLGNRVSVATPDGLRSGASSRASTRTLTPTAASNGFAHDQDVEEEQRKRIQDLEDNVRGLRKLLSSREAEAHELTAQLVDYKKISKTLQDELDVARSRLSAAEGRGSDEDELRRKYNKLKQEKEILAGEVVKLQERVEQSEVGLFRPGSAINHYDPNNPSVLQKKIDDLKSQLQDLQEAHESTVAELSVAEKKVIALTEENKVLRHSSEPVMDFQELKAENKTLRDKISTLWDQGRGDGDRRLRVECQQLKDDNRALKERNYKLHEEILSLKEENSQLRKGSRSPESPLTPKKSSDSYSMLESQDKRKADSLYDVSTSSKDKYKYTYDSKREPLKDRSIEKSEHRTSSYDDPKYGITDKFSDIYSTSTSKYDISDRYSSKDLLKDKTRSEKDRDRDRYLYDKDILLKRPRSSDGRLMPDTKDSYETGRYSILKTSRDRGQSSILKDRSRSESQKNVSLLDSYNPSSQGGESGREYKALAATYSEILRMTQQASLADKEEWSQSEGDLQLYNRGRSHTPEPYLDSRPQSYNRPTTPTSYRSQSPHSLYGVTGSSQYWSRSRDNGRASSHLPRPSFKWDEEMMLRPTSSMSERSDATSLVNSGYTNHKTESAKSSKRDYSVRNNDYRGEESDTGTDILVNAPAGYEQPPSPRGHEHHRRHRSLRSHKFQSYQDGLGSDGSESSGDEDDRRLSSLMRRRTKSADGREILRRSATNPPTPIRSGERPEFSKSATLTGPSGYRSVTPSILPTQQNKNLLSASSRKIKRSASVPSSIPLLDKFVYDPLLSEKDYRDLIEMVFGNKKSSQKSSGSLTSLTTGLRPFAPRTPGDINLEDVVKFSRQGGKLSQGTVKYVGHLPGRSDVYLGVELDKEDGKHDGIFENVRFFKCKPNKGVFVAFNKVVMAWSQ